MSLGVFADEEFQRIRALPRRDPDWTPEKEAEAIELLTDYFKIPGGKMTLKSVQARALCEASDTDTLVGEIGAGMGKFGLSALLFTLWNAKRGLLLVPAHLRQQTIDEWAKWSKHWRLLPLYDLDAGAVSGPHVRVLSYQSLSTVRFASFLDEFQPDVVIGDEAHYLARMKSARSKRLFRSLKATRKAQGWAAVKFVPLSGTFRRKSIKECAHIYEAALGVKSPLPTHYPTLEQWSFAIDEGVREDARIQPGALNDFCTVAQRAEGLDGVRRGVRDRILSSHGIIATSDSGIATSLVLQARHIEVPQEVVEALTRIRREQVLPTGETFDPGVVAWAHAREMGCGFSYRYVPVPPEDWKKARKGWGDFVRSAMDRPPYGMNLDSPLTVWNAVVAGRFGDPEAIEEWTKWRDLRRSFTPNPIPYWVDDFIVKDAEDYALKNNAIVWVGHASAFTKSESTGLVTEVDEDEIGNKFKRIPYFGAGKAGEGIRTYKGPCVASIRAHGTGKNLQHWSRALVMSLPSSGAALEQLLARLHREGQRADEVLFEFYCHTREMYQALVTARKDARYMNALNGNPQRVLYSTILDADGHAFDDTVYEQLLESDNPLWSK